MLTAISALNALLGENDELIARLAAPLWARAGRVISVSDLEWVRSIGGEAAPRILWSALKESKAIEGNPSRVSAAGLGRLFMLLLGVATDESPKSTDLPPRVVWTLPTMHPSHGSRGASYVSAIIDLIRAAKAQLLLVSPFIDMAGVGRLLEHLVDALLRGVRIILLTHDALNLSSVTSRAVEQLRQEAERARADLTLYSAEAGVGRDRVLNPLLHAKLVVCDTTQLLVGSANLTSYALSSNLETGVLLGSAAATEAWALINGVIEARCVYLVFRTNKG